MSDSPQTAAEFNAALGALLRQAADAGVGIEGGWDCRNGGDHPDWDVVITELEKE
ncbi:hypothetical protein [Halonotius terrestris]|uniref:hypothetical protein n=1 Tax=Halonotius terrestris TaxID=2487750 RepID=UPI00163C2B15|nr:hypothetical protein [Halonotius terrestris]